MNRRQFISNSLAGFTILPFASTAMQAQPSFVVPPEESLHELTFMQWPVSKQVHPDRYFLQMLQSTIANIANTISEFEPVIMLAANDYHTQAKKLLSDKVKIWDVPTEDLWCRDSGPLFALDNKGQQLISHLKFNGWGGKQVHNNDGQIVSRIAERLQLPVVDSGLHGEAGGVEHNGHGLLIAHESSWLNNNRNPGLTRDEIERRLLDAYGAQEMIWSKGVYDEDITDYHIDSLARLVERNVLLNLPDEPDNRDPFHQAALSTHDALLAAQLNTIVISEPNKRRVKSIDFVASYANYYICNGAVIAAEFGDPETDPLAVEALESLLPEREVITLNVDALGEVGGGIHCATQQLPAQA